MSRTVTLGNLVSRCKVLADQENQSTLSDNNWKEFIDRCYRDVYRELAKPGVGYFDTEATITSDGTADYPLPSDHLYTSGVAWVIDFAGRRRPLSELMPAERHYYKGLSGTAYAYEVVGSNVWLYPTPPSGQTYIHTYIPHPTDISAADDATLIEMASLDGEQALIWGVVFLARDKLEQDAQTAKSERDAALLRVTEDAACRSFMNARRRIVEEDLVLGGFDPRLDPADWRWSR